MAAVRLQQDSALPRLRQSSPPSTWPAPDPAAHTTLEQPTAESSFYLRHFLSAIHLIWLAGDPHDTAVNQHLASSLGWRGQRCCSTSDTASITAHWRHCSRSSVINNSPMSGHLYHVYSRVLTSCHPLLHTLYTWSRPPPHCRRTTLRRRGPRPGPPAPRAPLQSDSIEWCLVTRPGGRH